MLKKGVIRIILILLIVTLNIGCDQVSKTIIRNKVSADESIEVIGNHLTVMRVENTGAFLSVGDSLPAAAKNILLSVLPLIALIIGFGYILTKKSITRVPLAGFCFIVGGGIGNIFDRMLYGSVTDFLHIQAGAFHTGIFNMADVSIVTGTLIVLLHLLFKKNTPAPVAAVPTPDEL
ncbi:MAG: signal peptidase II [Chitinophagaceae bacterium]